MKKNILNIIFPGVLALILCSCEQETTWNLDTSKNFLVVDALITNENKIQSIRMYYSNENLNEASTPASGITAYITDGSNNSTFTESDSIPGLYQSSPFTTATNTNYKLVINHNGKIDSATASMSPVSQMRSYDFEQKGNLLKYVYAGSDLPAMTEIYYNWSSIPVYCEAYGSCFAAETYYDLDIIDVGKEFAPPKQEILFPIGTKIKRIKYSLSNEHQEFIRSLLIETEWRGGLFDVEQGNIPTNFTQGTRGWFGVCQVLTDSITVQR